MIDMFFEPILKFLGVHAKFIIGVVVNIILIWGISSIIDIFSKNIDKKLRQKNSDSPLLNLLPVLSKILKAVIVFLLLAGFLQSFGYNVTSLIAGFGITGLAVGFAAKEAIGNVFGSVGLLADRVYKIGDYIKFNGYEGFVENINLRSTTIRTLEGFVVNVPNNQLSNEEITNVSMANSRRIDITVDVEYGTSNEKLDTARRILKEIAEESPTILDNVEVFFDNLAASSIQVRVVAYTREVSWAKYVHIKSNIIKQIITRYRKEGIEFAFPSTSVYMAKEKLQLTKTIK